MLSATTGRFEERISLKSASIPASVIRKSSPSEPRELIRVSEFSSIIFGSPPRNDSAGARRPTRSNPFGPIIIPTIRSAITCGILKRRRNSGITAIRVIRIINKTRKASLLIGNLL